MLQKHRVSLHASTREQTTTRAHRTTVTQTQSVQTELTTRVDVRHDRAVVNRHAVTHSYEIRLRKHKRRLAAGPDGAIFTDVRTHQAEEPHDILSARQVHEDVTTKAMQSRLLKGEVELPARSVTARIPDELTREAASNNQPLGTNDPEQCNDSLARQND